MSMLKRCGLFIFSFCLLTFDFSCERDFSPVKIIAPPDTTSHNFTWQEYTFGTEGSYFKDVIAVNQNDVWAVGAISIRDTNGILTKYNAVHWDGQQGELKQISFYLCPNGTIPTPYPIQAAFAFSENDIWFTRGASFVHWDGNQFIHDCSMNNIIDGSIRKIWGRNSSDLYAVGYNGTIIHYDGSTWQKLESGTTVDLTDIWGSGPNNIWACGHETSENSSILLHFNGNFWQKVWETGVTFPQYPEITFMHSLWFQHSDTVVIVGNGIYHQPQDNINGIRIPENDFQFFQFAVRGSSYNNLFVSGAFGSLWHYNGTSWKDYPNLNGSGGLNSIGLFKKHIFAVGERYINPIVQYALIYHGIQK